MVSSPTSSAFLQPQLEGVHAEPLGQEVHLALGREHDLGLAEAAEGPAGHLVGAHHARVDA